MEVSSFIKHRLRELRLEQRDLAFAAGVTESYISQLLNRKKAPPAADRTGLYRKMNDFLKLPKGRLSAMVEIQRKEELMKKLELADLPLPCSRKFASSSSASANSKSGARCAKHSRNTLLVN